MSLQSLGRAVDATKELFEAHPYDLQAVGNGPLARLFERLLGSIPDSVVIPIIAKWAKPKLAENPFVDQLVKELNKS